MRITGKLLGWVCSRSWPGLEAAAVDYAWEQPAAETEQQQRGQHGGIVATRVYRQIGIGGGPCDIFRMITF